MAKRKSYYDIQSQSERLMKACKLYSSRFNLIRKIRDSYFENIRKSHKTYEYSCVLEEAIRHDMLKGLGYWVEVYRGSTPAGGDDPSEYDFVSDVNHTKLETKWKRYHHLRSVYQYGATK